MTRILTTEEKADVLKTIEQSFKKLSEDQKKTILYKIGISKIDIERLSEAELLTKVKTKYDTIISRIDIDNFSVDSKYKTAAEYMSGDKKSEFKTDVQTYKNL